MHSNKKKFVSLFTSSPLHDFLIPFKKAPNQWVARYIIIVFAIIVRCAVGLGSYSGFNTPFMFGDFEAQRHWLEITTKLPITKWYFYDLQYWGLDYPPLTAYHSWIFGMIGSWIDSTWFALDSSRGLENTDLKSYMRITVLISEIVCYIPAVLMYSKWMARYYNNASSIDQTIIAAAILFQPALIIIDHGHFQYNCVMLGLTLLSVVNLLYNKYALASIFFVLSLCFKQMALYYAPVIFCYMLSVCIWPLRVNFNLLRLISIGSSVIITFSIILFPFVYFGGFIQLKQILIRVFPFGRGIFEDKVANFWCSTNIIIKYRNIFNHDQLKLISLLLTLIGISPSCIAIFLKPKKNLIVWCLASCSLAFYLFSFQVHEKSILLPLMPITLLLNEVDPDVISMVCWICNISMFSMWPLLKKDQLELQYFVLGIMSNWLMGNLSWIRKTLQWMKIPVTAREMATPVLPHNLFWSMVIIGSYIAAGLLHFIEFIKPPPENLPDLWVIGNVVISFGCFSLFYLWTNYKIYQIANTKVKEN
ncbi:glycosyltransferase family 57 protein [[Candida] arabinofermentans NRRL YB-2248]|uniref:Alpha-1,3-glucosyltransferase n=1 Tax=[Candida] arabinofermentans NRRL YB-2248 TaxID=983967 RepID=A0A1E4T7C4_9ASCO|nr:glycosyltransferase family 57 protein [[Candida] arabinofermentans NRRL YB-2248]